MQEQVATRKDSIASEPKYKMKIEKDVDVPMRDGAKLKADIFRPDDGGHFPVLINMGIYQKDKLWIPPADLEEKPNPHMNWETVNPEWWVPRGYCCVRVDERGSGKSPGQSVLYSPQEAIDFYDAIEWAGHQPWSNGRVATIGISFFARTQWWVANLKPPSLACIVPWEGAADQYRDILYHGGIFGSGFIVGWFTTHMAHHLLGRAYQNNPDAFQDNVLWRFMRNSLDSGVFKSQQAQWDKIDLPMWAVGNWSGMGLHLRGATEGYMRAASKDKKLRIHCGTHYHPFYSDDGRRDQLRFFDYWLKDIDNDVMQEPPVKLAIRTGHGAYHFRYENEWPIARTQWTKLYFDLSASGTEGMAGTLSKTKPATTARRSYSASGASHAGHASASSTSLAAGAGGGISLITPPLEQDTEITGPLAAQLWVSSTTEDMDLFFTLRNIDPTVRIGLITSICGGTGLRQMSSSRCRWRFGQLRWCSKRATAFGSTFSRVTVSAAPPTRITTRITMSGRTQSIPAARRNLSCWCRSFRRTNPADCRTAAGPQRRGNAHRNTGGRRCRQRSSGAKNPTGVPVPSGIRRHRQRQSKPRVQPPSQS